jgi:periplasmic mercuric ion binding protein
MKTTHIITIAFSFVILFSCKKNENTPEVINVDTIEKVEKAAIPENADIAAVEFNISGMTCAIGCAAKIEKSLNNMDGIKTATVNFEKKSATVEYDLAQINPERITNRVLENGAQFKVSGLKNISGN